MRGTAMDTPWPQLAGAIMGNARSRRCYTARPSAIRVRLHGPTASFMTADWRAWKGCQSLPPIAIS
jgi:hypothetical protein